MTFEELDYNTLKAVIDATKENYMARIATVSGTGPILSSGQGSISVGGGFFGAFFAGLFVQLFSLIGTIIVISVMAIVVFSPDKVLKMTATGLE